MFILFSPQSIVFQNTHFSFGKSFEFLPLKMHQPITIENLEKRHRNIPPKILPGKKLEKSLEFKNKIFNAFYLEHPGPSQRFAIA